MIFFEKPNSKRFFLSFGLMCMSFTTYTQDGNDLFDDTYLHTVEIQSLEDLTYLDFHEQLAISHSGYYAAPIGLDEPYFMASIKIDGTTLDTVGVRYKGRSSFYASLMDKYAFKVDLNEFVPGQDYDGMKKFNLTTNLYDVTFMREKLTFEAYRRMGVRAPRVAYTKVYVNGEYRGLCSLVEQIDKTFIKNNFDEDTVGYLHKAGIMMFLKLPEQDTTVSFLSLNCPLKTRRTENNYQPIKDLIVNLTYTPDSLFREAMDTVFDMNTFIKMMAMDMVTNDNDHFIGGINYYLYSSPVDNRWFMLPWDYDRAFNTIFIIRDLPYEGGLEYPGEALRKRVARLYKDEYFDALCEILEVGLDSTWVDSRIAEITAVIGDELEADPVHPPLDPGFETYLDEAYYFPEELDVSIDSMIGMRQFIHIRYAQIREVLSDSGRTCEPATSELIENKNSTLALYPNPALNEVFIETNTAFSGSIHIFNLLGQDFGSEIPFTKQGTIYKIDITKLASGTYIVRVGDKQAKFYKL